MSYKVLVINVLLWIYETSAEFHLNSLYITTKSLDTFNQTKITLNNNWDYKDVNAADPNKLIEIQQQRQQQHSTKENEKLVINTTATTKTTQYLTKQKPLKTANIVRQQEPNSYHQKSNYFHHYLTTLIFNNHTSNKDNFNSNNKLKTIITTTCDENDAKEISQTVSDVKENPAFEQRIKKVEETVDDDFKVKYQTKYHVAANSLSNDDWLGKLPQLQLQRQQLQLYLQEQMMLLLPLQQRETFLSSSMTAASLLPHEYHYLADYRLIFNAEHHTQFYLHTLTRQNDFVAVATNQATATLASFKQNYGHNKYKDDYNYNKENEDNDEHINNNDDDGMTMIKLTNPRVFDIVADTIGSVFGVNTRPVAAAIQGINIEEIELYNGLSLRQSRFNPLNPCRILIHGWLGSSKAGIYNTLVPEYFKLQQGAYNIITIDWSKGALADYITASYRVKSVGIIVANFIDFLHQESGISFENIHVIGFSMGAHVAGIAGKYIQTGRLPVIVGLDPALPLFRYDSINERLDVGDANYVEVIHTSVGSYGYDRPLGHVDFYVNFGYNQPGCFFNECSHFRAFKVYAETLNNEILEGKECLKGLWWDMIKYKKCSRQMAKSLRMGVEGLSGNAMALRRGLYYVMTNAQPPYKVD